MVFALAFEGVLPLLLSRMVADPVDVLAYAVGGLLLWGALRLPLARNRAPQHTWSRLRLRSESRTRTQPLEVAR